jgi:hypothetical protein
VWHWVLRGSLDVVSAIWTLAIKIQASGQCIAYFERIQTECGIPTPLTIPLHSNIHWGMMDGMLRHSYHLCQVSCIFTCTRINTNDSFSLSIFLFALQMNYLVPSQLSDTQDSQRRISHGWHLYSKFWTGNVSMIHVQSSWMPTISSTSSRTKIRLCFGVQSLHSKNFRLHGRQSSTFHTTCYIRMPSNEV